MATMPGEGAHMNGSTKAERSSSSTALKWSHSSSIDAASRYRTSPIAFGNPPSDDTWVRLAFSAVPHAPELGIAVDVAARRPLPAAAKAREAPLEIEKEGIALLLAVVADVDPGFALLRHDAAHRVAAGAVDLGHVHRLAARAQRVKPRQLARPRQAAGMGGQDSVGAALHSFFLCRFLLLVFFLAINSTSGPAATAQAPARRSPCRARRT